MLTQAYSLSDVSTCRMDVRRQTSRYSRNRGEPLSFINTGVSVRIKVQPANINCCGRG